MAKKRITVARFDEAQSGVLKIVVDLNKPVRIDGLGVVTALRGRFADGAVGHL